MRVRLWAVPAQFGIALFLAAGCGEAPSHEAPPVGTHEGLALARTNRLHLTGHWCTSPGQTPVTAFAYNRNVVLGDAGPTADSDGDGLPDAVELASLSRSSAFTQDSDGDGLGDAVEVILGRDPSSYDAASSVCPNSSLGRWADADGNLLNRCEEEALGTDPARLDSDGDGLPDGVELMTRLGPLNDGDASLDFDADGLDNFGEVAAHTDPRAGDQSPAWAYATTLRPEGEACSALDISNVRLLPTGAVDGEAGWNEILVVLIEAPAVGPAALTARIVSARARLVCDDAGRLESCGASHPDGELRLDL